MTVPEDRERGALKKIQEKLPGRKKRDTKPQNTRSGAEDSNNEGIANIILGKKSSSIVNLPGIGPSTAKDLFENGYETVVSLATATVKELTSFSTIGVTAAEKMISIAQETLEFGYETSLEIREKRKHLSRLTTGSQHLDELFGGGGIETESTTEFFGEFRTGKTQIAHQLCVTVQLPRCMGGLCDDPGNEPVLVIYIDTEGTYRPERVEAICGRYKDVIDKEEIHGNIRRYRAFNSYHQTKVLEKVLIDVQRENIKLVILDSLTAHVRREFRGRGDLHDRAAVLLKNTGILTKLAEVHGVTAVFTNQVHAKPDMFFGDPTGPVGGHIVAHAAHTRVYLRKSKGNRRIARIYDSPFLPEGEGVFCIADRGIIDDE